MPHTRSIVVYILASKPYGTLYIGVTNDLRRRMIEHRDGRGSAFTRRYGVTKLMWYEQHQNSLAAIEREKSLKFWPRDWKINLIEQDNPHWNDLFPAIAASEWE